MATSQATTALEEARRAKMEAESEAALLVEQVRVALADLRAASGPTRGKKGAQVEQQEIEALAGLLEQAEAGMREGDYLAARAHAEAVLEQLPLSGTAVDESAQEW